MHAPFDLPSIRKSAWFGLTATSRSTLWPLLLKYLPASCTDPTAYYTKKRTEYHAIARHLTTAPNACFDSASMHQIQIDIQRTPSIAPEHHTEICRLLYVWAVRHPASGYVQGINDLVVPFYWVFFVDGEGDGEGARSAEDAEADVYWCLDRLLSNLQDNYTVGQSGIFRKIGDLRMIIAQTHPQLARHLDAQGVDYNAFAFRWLNCLLVREFPLQSCLRLWDTLLAEGEFSRFHVCLCAALLLKVGRSLVHWDFQQCMIALQSPPTATYTVGEVEELLAEGFILHSIYKP